MLKYLIDAGGEGVGPSAYWRRRLHFQLEKEFCRTDSRGGPREWSGVKWSGVEWSGCAVSVCLAVSVYGMAAAWRRRSVNVYSVSVYSGSVYSV